MNVVSQHLADAMAIDELERQLRFKRAWQAYHGDAPKPLKVRQGDPDDNVQVNLARVIVDKAVAFLFGKDVSFELDEQQRTPPDRAADACWRRTGGS